MNLFAGIGKIVDVNQNGKALKFTLATEQEKPCYIPCLIFNPTDEVKEKIEQLRSIEQAVWLQGKVSSYEFEYQGRTIRKIEIVTFANSIKTI
jgi:hypothetical protein